MIEVSLSPADVSNIRFARSPMEEALASLSAFTDPRRREMHRAWVAAVRPALMHLDLTMLRAVSADPHWRPDFLTPPLDRWDVGFPEELESLRATTPEAIHQSMPQPVPPALRTLCDNPPRELGRLADQLRSYWRVAIDPVWPRLRALHDADLQHRTAGLVSGGLAKHHLSVLRRCSPVASRRVGREVFYQRTKLGTRLRHGR